MTDSNPTIDSWTVTTDPSDDSHLLVGQEKVGANDGCAATHDNVTLNMVP